MNIQKLGWYLQLEECSMIWQSERILMNINILRYSLFGIAGGQEVDRNFC